MFSIYKYTFPNGKIYIGKTKSSIEDRAGANGVRYGNRTLVGRAIRKYGWVNIKKEIVMSGLSSSQANEKEIELIKELNATDRSVGYNLTKGGDGGAVKGHVVSLETRRKIGEKNKIALKGRKVPQEQVERMRNTLMGHPVSQTTREKIRAAVTGYKHTDETKKKMSENNCMRRPEVVEKMKETLKKTQKERTQKRMNTMRERYPNGLKQSAESNKKRSDKLKGIKRSEETRQKMRKPKSPEAIENMRKAQIEAWKRRKGI